MAGVEPARQRHQILNLTRLPVPPHSEKATSRIRTDDKCLEGTYVTTTP